MIGARALPEKWLVALELRAVIERLGTDLHRGCIVGQPLAEDEYPPS